MNRIFGFPLEKFQAKSLFEHLCLFAKHWIFDLKQLNARPSRNEPIWCRLCLGDRCCASHLQTLELLPSDVDIGVVVVVVVFVRINGAHPLQIPIHLVIYLPKYLSENWWIIDGANSNLLTNCSLRAAPTGSSRLLATQNTHTIIVA